MIVVGSVRSGGATTLALALAASVDEGVLVEADPDGGVLALRYGLGREPGLVTLAAAPRGGGYDLLEHAQRLPGGLAVMVAPESPERTAQILASAGARLGSVLARVAHPPVVVDIGRLRSASPARPLAGAAEFVLIVARPRAEELVAAAERVREIGDRAGMVLVGAGPYSPAEVAEQLGCLVFGPVAHDPRAARVLVEGGRTASLSRSARVRSARGLARTLFGPERLDKLSGAGQLESTGAGR